ncbi:MAG TPA: cob(I)yrinic acid a,c-diamide adenosyltransferase [Candidatus Gallacutalibacter stercoravium]|nr:cob(I)yrinic acid a,c-diamide adenosyltransferase [Candidatus Gallacutalibacter stercoravium]
MAEIQGLIHIYCGDGKGKTTATVGLCVRAAGHGRRVLFVQFLKGDTSGERAALSALPGVTVAPCPHEIKFTFQMNPQEKQEAGRLWSDQLRRAVQACREEPYDLLVLDEIFDAVATGMVQEEELLAFLRGKPRGLEVALTGRAPGQAFLQLADYVSQVQMVKHPYERGVPAREGIEY